MRFLFATSQLVGGKIIRWATGEPVSHCALLFDQAQVVYHSSLGGIQKLSLQAFNVVHEVVWTQPVDVPLGLEGIFETAFQAALKPITGYDYPAIAYLGYRALLRKAVGLPWPASNPDNHVGLDLCTEILTQFATVYADLIRPLPNLPTPSRLATMTPGHVYLYLHGVFGGQISKPVGEKA